MPTDPNHAPPYNQTPILFWWIVGIGVALALLPTVWTALDLQAAGLFLGPDAYNGVFRWWWVELINLYVPAAFRVLVFVALGGWIAATQPAKLAAVARAWRISTIAGGAGALASIGWFTAFAIRPAADVRTLALVEVFFSYLVSRRLLREQLARTEQVGLALVVLGVLLVCLNL